MKIPEELKEKLLSELNFIITKIETETDAKRRHYFLSAAHGAFERTMRFYSNGELYLVNFTLQICYNTIGSLQNRIASGDMAIIPPSDLWEKVVSHLGSLVTAITEEASTYPILEELVMLTWALTGPGYYTTNYLKSLEPTNP